MKLTVIKSSIANIMPLCKREFVAYFNSPIAYVFAAVFLVVTNWLFFQQFFLANQAMLRDWFGLLPWMFLLLAPAITMRSWAEEKKTNTIEFLLTLPIRDSEVVAAKFLSSFLFLGLILALSLTMPITVGRLGDLDAGVAAAGYVGALLLGGMYLSIGLLVSSFTRNQIVAFLVSLSVMFSLFIIGSNNVLSFLSGPIASVLQFLSTATHFNSVSRGIFDTRDIIYYLSFTALFLYLNVQSISSRNWR
ncbi:MAG: ABC transporter permease subunit [Parcubacteria group bacterium]|nr:ABC transporter permease subunit [Parcubacteria group bacterium]